MRPQAFINLAAHEDHHPEDLGWNDLGHDAEPAAVIALPGHDIPAAEDTVAAPAVLHQQQALAEQIDPATEHTSERSLARAAPGSRGRAAFTLRLDPERHLKLRLVSALSHRSAQQIVTAALDSLLQDQSDQIASALAPSPKG
jgi:hypothetical protein